MRTVLDEGYVTIREAARLLQVHVSTIRRWIDGGDLPAQRVGQRRILVKRADLARLITPARAEQENEHVDSGPSLIVPSLTAEDQRKLLAAVEAARAAQLAQLARRGGKPFPSSDALIDELRDERTRELP